MTYKEEKRDLFTVDFNKYTPVHCISLDLKMGAGIAVPMRQKFHLEGLKMVPEKAVGKAILFNGVFNLITKKKYWLKPNSFTIRNCLNDMKRIIDDSRIKKLVMPRLGSGLDKQDWTAVRSLIMETFTETDIEILVCYL